MAMVRVDGKEVKPGDFETIEQSPERLRVWERWWYRMRSRVLWTLEGVDGQSSGPGTSIWLGRNGRPQRSQIHEFGWLVIVRCA